MNTTVQPVNALAVTSSGSYPVGGGGYALFNCVDQNGALHAPLHLFDLTATNNVIGGTFTGYNPRGMQYAF
jgi:hypothetical protein